MKVLSTVCAMKVLDGLLSNFMFQLQSPLDKAREKLNEINQRKGGSSRQPSPSNSEVGL